MSATLWTKWYWPDWAGDKALGMCSLAAQGLWMRMLCLAAEGKPYGYVNIDGQELTEEELGKLAGIPAREASKYLAELKRYRVVKIDGRGRLYSKRMVADEKKRRTNKKNGGEGGNPTLRKHSTNSGSDNPPDNRPDNPPDKGGDKAQKPEARSQRPEKKKEQTPKSSPSGGKGVNRRRRGAAPEAAAPTLSPDEEALQRVLIWLETGMWSPGWGPKPGELGCCVPQSIIDRARAKHAARQEGEAA